MAHTWGPVTNPVEHDVKPIASHAEGSVTTPSPTSHTRGEITDNENYDASDGRHSKSDHGGWPSIDSNSGPVSHNDLGESQGKFKDGPGKWRQT